MFSNLQAKYAELSDKLNLGNQNYSLTSKSWAYWDIAKQFYLFTHSSESSPTYRLANPMEDLQVRAEIIDRMLGWDIFGKRETLLNNWLSTARNLKPEGASEIFKTLSSGKKVLSSAELSHLGKLVLDSLK